MEHCEYGLNLKIERRNASTIRGSHSDTKIWIKITMPWRSNLHYRLTWSALFEVAYWSDYKMIYKWGMAEIDFTWNERIDCHKNDVNIHEVNKYLFNFINQSKVGLELQNKAKSRTKCLKVENVIICEFSWVQIFSIFDTDEWHKHETRFVIFMKQIFIDINTYDINFWSPRNFKKPSFITQNGTFSTKRNSCRSCFWTLWFRDNGHLSLVHLWTIKSLHHLYMVILLWQHAVFS